MVDYPHRRKPELACLPDFECVFLGAYRILSVPGASVKVLGVAVTPAGSPERVTLTALENRFAGTTEMETV
jgi:hypothetical protein